jgi:16S rRNA (uracil1498-N3)-methyltransferase
LVHLPLSFDAALMHWQAQGIPGIIFALPPEREPAALRTVLAGMTSAPALAVFIGPEGDFSPGEVAAAAAVGLRAASLGPRVLRAETAAVIAVALCLYDLSPP